MTAREPGPLPKPALTHDRHGHMLLIGPCYTADQLRAYAAQEVAAERARCAMICEDLDAEYTSAELPGFVLEMAAERIRSA